MEVRNIKYNLRGTIDCEINHPLHGWTPFTASPEDTEQFGRDIYAECIEEIHGAIAPYIAPVKTAKQIQAEITNAVQSHLDSAAKASGYDDILSACSYAVMPNAFQEEGAKFLHWRSLVWIHCYQVLADVQSGKRTTPTPEQLINELPVR